MSTTKQKGFTLVEIMIVVGIIAILAAIALPMYNEYVRQAARTAGQNYLSGVAQQQELRFQNTRAYSANWADFDQAPFATVFPEVDSRYTRPANIGVTAAGGGLPATFTITLNPKAGGLLAGEGPVTISSDGNRTWVDRHGNMKQWSEK